MGISAWLGAIRDVVLPRGCAGCDAPDAVVCGECRELLDRTVAFDMPGTSMGRGYACAWYRGAVRRVILGWKDHHDEECDGPLSEAMAVLAARCLQSTVSGMRTVLVVPAPSSSASVHRRGRRHTTVLAAAANDSVVVLAKLGDGDVVVVSDTGEVWQPLPEDELLDGVRTTSLCQPDPLESLRVVALPAEQVRLAYLCTDGFGKPQMDDQWWRQVGSELVQRAAEHGTDWLTERLPGWLEEPAEVGGDDTTMAVLVATS